MTVRDAIIAVLRALLIWFGAAIVRLENQRYANSLQMCGQQQQLPPQPDCQVETRTHWTWHLLYGLRIL